MKLSKLCFDIELPFTVFDLAICSQSTKFCNISGIGRITENRIHLHFDEKTLNTLNANLYLLFLNYHYKREKLLYLLVDVYTYR
jgi:hypothetical protein